jgi:SSS family solute:Na+ symporter
LDYLSTFDYGIICGYFALLLGLGFYLKRKASESVEDYFIGGRKLPWWALGISGMAHTFDITGTMVVVSFLFMLGPRGIFIGFRAAAMLILPFMLLWVGKWHRRSQCITNADWMIFRFGDGLGGRLAEMTSVLTMVLIGVGMVAYLATGVGLFLSMFLPFSPFQCALVMIGAATVYTMVSGFYGVVFTDIFQSAIILVAVVIISLTAFFTIRDSDSVTALAAQVTGNTDWGSSLPRWNTEMPKGYEVYKHLTMFMLFYLLRNVFDGMGRGGDPRYFGARNDRECGTLTFLWTWLFMIRWPLMMAFAALGLFVVKDLYPDQTVLTQAATLIKEHVPGIQPAQWSAVVSGIMNHPEQYSGELIGGLRSLLGGGADWAQKLHLLSFHGTVNPERILPAVLLFGINQGFRGLMVVALIAASMSTFDSSINAVTGFLTRNVYHKYVRPRAKTSELIYASWAFVVLLVVGGFLLARSATSINDIWTWILMALLAGVLVPSLLRLYWWRFNGGGYAIGTAVGLCAAILQRKLYPTLDERLVLLVMLAIGLAGSFAGTFLTRPTDRKVLENFYRITRPFGLWGPLKKILSDDVRAAMEREHRNDILAVPFVMLWQVTWFMMPMQLVIHSYRAFWVTFSLFVVGLTGVYFLWYRNLPPAHDTQTETGTL